MKTIVQCLVCGERQVVPKETNNEQLHCTTCDEDTPHSLDLEASMEMNDYELLTPSRP